MTSPLRQAILMSSRTRSQSASLSRLQRLSAWMLPQNRQSSTETTPDPDVLHQKNFGSRTFTLNRPKKLNALDLSMVRNMTPQLQAWEASDLCKVVILKGNGEKALCAGGDVATVVKLAQAHDPHALSFFQEEYALDHFIALMETPFVSIMDGITMGGGVGLSVHAPFRIATERTLFAMPETTIGFFPDVGGGFFLPRLDGEIGTYLALSSDRLKGIDALFAGVATHYIPSDRLPALEERLSELDTSDKDVINSAINEFADGPVEGYQFPLGGNVRKIIDRCFKFNAVEDIFQALQKENDPWADKALATLKERSPISLKVTLEMIRRGKGMSITDVFNMDYQLVQKFLDTEDFHTGVTARLITKPPEAPKWNPSTLEGVSDEQVASFYAPPAPQRLALISKKSSYSEYPHRSFSLPNDEDVRLVVTGEGPDSGSYAHTLQDVEKIILRSRSTKPGTVEKVREIVARCCTESADDKTLSWTYKP